MKIHVKAKANEFKFVTVKESDDCIKKCKEYKVKCDILRLELGLFNNTYHLRIEGTEKDVEAFLEFLRMEGFKIKNF